MGSLYAINSAMHKKSNSRAQTSCLRQLWADSVDPLSGPNHPKRRLNPSKKGPRSGPFLRAMARLFIRWVPLTFWQMDRLSQRNLYIILSINESRQGRPLWGQFERDFSTPSTLPNHGGAQYHRTQQSLRLSWRAAPLSMSTCYFWKKGGFEPSIWEKIKGLNPLFWKKKFEPSIWEKYKV